MFSNRHNPDYPIEDSVHRYSNTSTQRPTTHPDKDSQPPVYQVGLGQRVYILPGALWATLGHLPPISQHPRTPGHKAFRSQLTANKLGGLRFAGVGSQWSTVQPRSARANPLWQPRALGIWGRYLTTKIPHLSGRRMGYPACPEQNFISTPPPPPPPCSRQNGRHFAGNIFKCIFLK